jgi:hypothetical protein
VINEQLKEQRWAEALRNRQTALDDRAQVALRDASGPFKTGRKPPSSSLLRVIAGGRPRAAPITLYVTGRESPVPANL